MPTRRRQHIRRRVFTLLLIIFLVIAGIIGFNAVKHLPFLWQLTFNKQIALKKTQENKINLLILGVGGGTHDGPDLTDTIIFASIDPNTKKVVLISLPRDLWVPELKAKINAAYTYGELKEKGGGLVLAKALIGKVLGQQIDYAVKIDFDGFVKAIDMVGGLDISVDNTFDDYEYPITGKEDDTCGHTDQEIASLSAQLASGSATELDTFPCRYEHLHFDRGLQHMDGTTALKYVRSRHALGVEGSDFARSKRQQKVIEAFKEKVFSLGTILDPVKTIGLINTIQSSIDTDIQESDYDDFIRLAQKLKGAKITSTVIDVGDEANNRFGLLINPPISDEYNNAWVLAPRTGNGNYIEIQQYVACELKSGNCIVGQNGILTPTPPVTPAVKRK